MRVKLCALALLAALLLGCKPQPSLPLLDDPALEAWARAMIAVIQSPAYEKACRTDDEAWQLAVFYFARVAEDSPRLRDEYAAAFVSEGYARELYNVALENCLPNDLDWRGEALDDLESATWPIFWAALDAPTTERM